MANHFVLLSRDSLDLVLRTTAVTPSITDSLDTPTDAENQSNNNSSGAVVLRYPGRTNPFGVTIPAYLINTGLLVQTLNDNGCFFSLVLQYNEFCVGGPIFSTILTFLFLS